MIITADDIRGVRDLAVNIQDNRRIDPYIKETENLYVLPAFGAALYRDIEANRDRYKELLDGGYYADGEKWFAGLTAACAYLAYSRMLYNQPVNVTAFGVVYKDGEFSSRTDEAALTRAAKQAEDIGKKYLAGCVDYLKDTGAIGGKCRRDGDSINRRYKVIGD